MTSNQSYANLSINNQSSSSATNSIAPSIKSPLSTSSSSSSISSLNVLDLNHKKITKPSETNQTPTPPVPLVKIENKAIFIDNAPLVTNLNIISSGISPSTPIQQNSSSKSNHQPTPVTTTKPNEVRPKTLNNVNDNLQHLHRRLQIEILKQLIKLKNINNDWFDIIMPLVWKCVDLVRPDVKHDNDSMDIRSYIKIKKLPGGSKTDCRIINGLVFSKNVAHKNMKSEVKNPKVLLLRSSIEYQRTEEDVLVGAFIYSREPVFKESL